MMIQQPDEEKLQELILYFALKSEADPSFGTTKLNKLLFYCDFTAYRLYGRSITGHSYQKLERGPTLRRMLPVVEKMKQQQLCTEVDREHFGFRQRRLVANRPPRASVFTSEEIYLADQIWSDLLTKNAREVSEISHDFVGWEAAEFGETIPYETVFVGDPKTPLSPGEIEFCRGLESTLQ
jgi:Protein of unknown function (DUF4065)